MTGEHSNVCGGSSAERRYYCHASRAEEDKAPKGQTSEFAERGSMLHAAIELVLINWPENMKQAQPFVDECVGQNFGFDYDPIDDELVATKLGPALTEWFRIVKEYGFVDWMIEVRVSMETVIGGAFGKTDIIAIDKQNRLHVLDWKFGDGVPVPAEDNKGLMFYAGAALNDDDEEMTDFLKDVYDDTEVILHIVQPNERGHIHQEWQTNVEHIENFVDQLAAAIDKSYQPNVQPKPGDYCRWCAAANTCPATKQLVAATAKKKIEGMDAAELGTFLEQLTMVVALKEKAFSFAQKQLEAGHIVPGWKLVQKRSARHWINEAEALDYCKRSRMKREKYMNESLKTPPQMEKLVGEKVYSKKIAPMVHSTSSGLTIAPDTDKRPAVVGSVELLANALENASPAKAATKAKD